MLWGWGLGGGGVGVWVVGLRSPVYFISWHYYASTNSYFLFYCYTATCQLHVKPAQMLSIWPQHTIIKHWNICFSLLINYVTKDRCSIPMHTTVMLGLLKFSLRATIDHHGPSIQSGHYTASINCCKKSHSIGTKTQLRSMKLLIAKTPLLHMLCFMNWMTYEFWTRTGGWEFDHLITTMALAHPFHPINSRSRKKRRNLWVERCVSYWWPLFLSRNSVLIYIYIYIYICILYRSSLIWSIYTYTMIVVQYWLSCTLSHSIRLFLRVRGSCVECHFLFCLVYQLCLALWQIA